MNYGFRFNTEHYSKLRVTRQNLKLIIDTYKEIGQHPMIGSILTDGNDIIGMVDTVYKYWSTGWCILLNVKEAPNTYSQIMWENINCSDTLILDQIKYNKMRYGIINQLQESDYGQN